MNGWRRIASCFIIYESLLHSLPGFPCIHSSHAHDSLRQIQSYDKGPDGGLIINEAQATIVRRIYGDFLAGMSPYAIARKLTEDGIPSPAGKPKWNDLTI